MNVPWHRIKSFADQFRRCAVDDATTAVLLAEDDNRPELVATATAALQHLGAAVSTVILPTPAHP